MNADSHERLTQKGVDEQFKANYARRAGDTTLDAQRMSEQEELLKSSTTLSHDKATYKLSQLVADHDRFSSAQHDKYAAKDDWRAAIGTWSDTMNFKGSVKKSDSAEKIGRRIFGDTERDAGGVKKTLVLPVLHELRYRGRKSSVLRAEFSAGKMSEDELNRQFDWVNSDGSEKSVLETIQSDKVVHRPRGTQPSDVLLSFKNYDTMNPGWRPLGEWLAEDRAKSEKEQQLDHTTWDALLNDPISEQRRTFDLAVAETARYVSNYKTYKGTSSAWGSTTRAARIEKGVSQPRGPAKQTAVGSKRSGKQAVCEMPTKYQVDILGVSSAKKKKQEELSQITNRFEVIRNVAVNSAVSRDARILDVEWMCDVYLEISVLLEESEALVWQHTPHNYILHRDGGPAWRSFEDKRSYCTEKYKEWHREHVVCGFEDVHRFSQGYRELLDDDGEVVIRQPPYAAVKSSIDQFLNIDFKKLDTYHNDLYIAVVNVINKFGALNRSIMQKAGTANALQPLGYNLWDPSSTEGALAHGLKVRHLPRPDPVLAMVDENDQSNEYPDDGCYLCSEFLIGKTWYPYANGVFYSTDYKPFVTDEDGRVCAPEGCWDPDDEQLDDCGYDIPSDSLPPMPAHFAEDDEELPDKFPEYPDLQEVASVLEEIC
tara:strand:+ start:333 stop:2297 length:1965 start_codon:yes stop_codon:yes gene_type:complete